VENSFASCFDIKIHHDLTSNFFFLSYALKSKTDGPIALLKPHILFQTKPINMSTMDKVKQALHLDKDKSTTSTTHHNGGVPEGTAGPHSNRIANAADPRIDSDRSYPHFFLI
jgi:hypothetical protein